MKLIERTDCLSELRSLVGRPISKTITAVRRAAEHYAKR